MENLNDTLSEIIKVKNEIINLSDVTKALAKSSVDDLVILLNSFDKLFSSSKKDVKEMLNSSEALRDAYAELQEKIVAGGIAIKDINDSLKQQREDALIDEKTQLEIIKEMQSQRKILNEIAELQNRLSDANLNLSQDESDKIKDRITLLDTENKKIVTKYNNKKAGHLNEYRYAMELSTTHSDTLDKLDAISDLQEKAAVSANNYANESERAKRALGEQEKKISAVVEGAKTLWVYAKHVAGKWADFNDTAYKSGRAIGMNHSQLVGYQRAYMQNTKEMAAKYGILGKEILKFQDAYTSSTGRALLLSNEQTESMAAMSKLAGEGVTSQVAAEMDNFGISIDDAMVNLGMTQERAMKYGLNATKSGELFAKNIKLASKYTFRDGIDGVSKMTLLSQRLRFNLEAVGDVADKFSTIEGAIDASAKLQMLGGTYAQQFGSPMTAMYESLNDPAALMERITKMYASKGVFNQRTGEVEVGSMDKRFIKESASAAGLSYDDAFKMTTSIVRNNQIEGEIDKGQGFSEVNKIAIQNLATWDAEKNGHVINFKDEEGKEYKAEVKNLDKETLEYIQRQTISEETMHKDVRDIAQTLKARFKTRAKSTVSLYERKAGLEEVTNTMKAQGVDGVMNSINDFLTELTAGEGALNKVFTALTNLTTTFVLLGAAVKVGSVVFKTMLGKSISEILGRRAARAVVRGGLGGRVINSLGRGARGVGNTISRGGSAVWNGVRGLGRGIGIGAMGLGRGIGNVVNRSGTAIRGLGRGIGGVASTAGKGLWKGIKGAGGAIAKFAKGKGGKVGLIAGALTLLGVGTASAMSKKDENDPKNEIDKEKGIKESGDKVLIELNKQTQLLEIIAKLKSPNTYAINGDSSSITEEGNLTNSFSTAKLGADVGLMGAKTQIGRKVLGKTAGRSGLKLAANAGKMLKAGNPLGWIGMGLDVGNMAGKATGAWEEGSTTDKMMNIGSSTATGASFGAMIGSVIPGLGTAIGGAVGAAVGGLVGVVDNYGEDIKKWAIGGDTLSNSDKQQQIYEETKFGETSITDPQIQVKAALATVKIHDVLISIWHQLNGKQSNGTKEDKGFFGDALDVLTMPLKASVSVAKSIVSTPFDIMNSTRDISPKINPINIAPMVGRENGVRQLPTIGMNPSLASNNENSVRNQYNQTIKIPDINLNINGTMKLVSDNKSVDLDIKKLMDNPQFKEAIVKMVKDGLDKNQGLGKINRNSITSQRTSSGYKS